MTAPACAPRPRDAGGTKETNLTKEAGGGEQVLRQLRQVRSPAFPDGTELVHAYTRAEAIADGVLVDVSRQASPAEMRGGFTVPVAVTAALWAAIKAIPDRLAGIADARGRLHDVLWMASLAARRQPGASFAVRMPCRGTRKQTLRLLAAIGPGDDGAPVVTIGFPEDL